MTIRVLIVDDHAVVRAGLRRVLDAEPDIETVGEAATAERAIFEAIENKPDVVLLDVMMPETTGIEGMPALLQAVPDAKVLVLSMQDDPRYVREAFDAGASGYVLKEAADTEVVGAIRAVAAGERYVHPSLGAKLFAADSEERRRAEEDPLSEREREVLHLLALGHTNQEIAKQLFISVRTAETHRAHIMQKLHLGSRAELVRYALAEGLLDPQDQSGTLALTARPCAQDAVAVGSEQTDERDGCDQARDRIGRQAPVADGVDHGELDDEQVAAEGGGSQRDSRRDRACKRTAAERRCSDDQIADDPESGHRHAEELGVLGALNRLAAAGRAEQAGTRPAGDEHVRGNAGARQRERNEESSAGRGRSFREQTVQLAPEGVGVQRAHSQRRRGHRPCGLPGRTACPGRRHVRLRCGGGELALDPGRVGAVEHPLRVEPVPPKLRRSSVRDPARILGALLHEEPVHDVPEPVLLSGGERGPQGRVRLRRRGRRARGRRRGRGRRGRTRSTIVGKASRAHCAQ